MYSYNFSLLIKNLAAHMKKAATGEEISLDTIDNDELNELAISFNDIVSGLKELKEKDKIITELEKNHSFDDLFKFGVNLLKENELDNSIALFKTLTILKPEGFGGYFNLGVAYAKKKDYHTSLEMFGKALNSNSDHELTQKYIDRINRLKNASMSAP